MIALWCDEGETSAFMAGARARIDRNNGRSIHSQYKYQVQYLHWRQSGTLSVWQARKDIGSHIMHALSMLMLMLLTFSRHGDDVGSY